MDATLPDGLPGGTSRFRIGDEILGRYVVVSPLGQGGMGVVYRCVDKVGRVEVAVKGLPPEVAHSPDEIESVRENFQLVHRLRHENIAAALTLEQNARTGEYFLIMDFAPGVNLKRWMAAHAGRAHRTRQLAVLRQIADALDYAHRARPTCVIHRDIKPENVMVDDVDRVSVLDFGLAAAVRASMSRVSLQVRSTSGTPVYKSPEQWRGQPQRAAADQYALAVIAYQMFSGAVPFDGDDLDILGRAILNEPVQPVEDVSAAVNAALAKGLAKRPEERFPTCLAFVEALEDGEKEVAEGVASPTITHAVPVQAEGRAPVAQERAERPKGLYKVKRPPSLYKVIDLASGTVEDIAAVPPGGWTEEHKTSKLVLRRIEPGTFTMGSPTSEEGHSEHESQHRVTLTQPFYLGVFEVTQGQWRRMMGNSPSMFEGEDARPVERVSYEDIRGCNQGAWWPRTSSVDSESFFGRLRARTPGLVLDLPTEAQWEYACRAGTTTAFAWGNALNGDRANCDGRWPYGTLKKGSYKGTTCDVGLYAPNGWGLYDMHGNVWEWCLDWFEEHLKDATDPVGPASGACRVYRGGGWVSGARLCRSANRFRFTPGNCNGDLGFRVCCSAGPSE